MIGIFFAAMLSSQEVLQRYERALETLVAPKNQIFSYSISQAGPTNIEQKHIVYRSGNTVRDELLGTSGAKERPTTVTSRPDRYAIGRIAPQARAYGFLFSRKVVIEGETLYLYDTYPLAQTTAGFVVTQVAIDGTYFLPRLIVFHSTNGIVIGKGSIQYAPVGGYWIPLLAMIEVPMNGKPARERIAWTGYRFPASLPALTFSR